MTRKRSIVFMSRICFTLILIVLAFSRNADAAVILDRDLRWLNFLQAEIIEVVVSDQVNDGCWTDIGATKTAVELELSRSGYKLTDETGTIHPTVFVRAFHPTVFVRAYGYAATNGYADGDLGCIVSYELTLVVGDFTTLSNAAAENDLSSFFFRTLYSQPGLMSGSKETMNSRLKNTFENLTQGLLVRAQKEKQHILDAIEEQGDEGAQWLSIVDTYGAK